MSATTIGAFATQPRAKPAATPAPAPRPAMPRTVRLFGLAVTDTSRAEAAEWLVSRAVRGVRSEVAFLNAHCVNVMSRDAAYREALGRATRVLADGAGIALAARAAGVRLTDNVNGTDLLPLVCSEAAVRGAPMFLLGGQPGVAAEAARRLAHAHPGLVVVGTHHGYLAGRADEDAAIDAINASGASILLAGLGVPMQELWVARNRHRLAPAVVAGVGGLFDYYSGRIPRAPAALRRRGLEWAWRLAMEPRRLAGRYVAGNAAFLVRLAALRLLTPEAFASPAEVARDSPGAILG